MLTKTINLSRCVTSQTSPPRKIPGTLLSRESVSLEEEPQIRTKQRKKKRRILSNHYLNGDVWWQSKGGRRILFSQEEEVCLSSCIRMHLISHQFINNSISNFEKGLRIITVVHQNGITFPIGLIKTPSSFLYLQYEE